MRMSNPMMSGVFCLLCLVQVDASPSVEPMPSDIPLVINEFLASNSSRETDPQGQHEDWIELYNHGPHAIDMGGMYVTDNVSDPTQWQIPPGTMIGPGDYLMLWADNDVTDAGLHTSFKLAANGEEIGLFDRDGITLIDSVIFSSQTPDLSYGRYPDASEDWRFLWLPTPGRENSDAYLGEVQALTFSHDNSIHDAPFFVTLATDTEEAVIYYTLYGDDPLRLNGRGKPVGKVYTEPILIDKSTCLRAQAIKTGWKSSSLEARTYTFLDPDVRTFSSNLPIVIIETYGQRVVYSGNLDYTPSSVVVLEPDDTSGRAAIHGPFEFSGRSGFRVRGRSSSFLWPKMQYALELWDPYDGDKPVSLLGLPAESDWVLLGPYSDKTLMRTVLPFQWSNEIGRYAARTQFVEMFLNTDDRVLSYGDYVGVYVFMEKIKRDENRVNIKALAPGHNDEPEITGGYLLRKDWAESPHFNTVTGMELEYREPEAQEITEPQKAYIKGYMDEFETVLYGNDFKDPAEGYVKYIDVASFIDFHLLTEMPKNSDSYYHSTFMVKDRAKTLELGPVWDYNLSMGNFGNGSLSSALGWYYPERTANGTHKWFIRLFEDLEFRLKTADRWFELRETVFSHDKLLADIDTYAWLLDEAQARNFERWDVLGQQIDYNPPGWSDRNTYQKEVDWLKTWLEDRLAWMDQAMAEERASVPPLFFIEGVEHNDNGYVQRGSTLSLSSEEGRLYYTLDGSDPRLPGKAQQTESPRLVLVPEEAGKTLLIPSGSISDAWTGAGFFSERDWMTGAGTIGYDTEGAYRDLIDTDLGDRMSQGQTGCYIRAHFNNAIEDMTPYDIMTLRMRYDDGFVAYLNGVEVARSHAPMSLSWNAVATAEIPDGAAIDYQDFDLSSHLTALKQGQNILAIHGLNLGPGDSDFLISFELVIENSPPSGDFGMSPSAHAYMAPMTLTQSVTVKARALIGNAWSAMNTATYVVGPVAEALYVTRVTAQPPQESEAAFVELTNVGTETINLNLIKFTGGIEFTFPNIELAPGELMAVVQDREAFEARYGTDIPAAGQYTGHLDPGEKVRLEDALGQTLYEVTVQGH
ncbi:MAG: CotH kinase family protein [Phycisphaerae bacterium]|nr:CotH kinase family protein [Phycisphaerae bacterium]